VTRPFDCCLALELEAQFDEERLAAAPVEDVCLQAERQRI
jgi:hypothetical protein